MELAPKLKTDGASLSDYLVLLAIAKWMGKDDEGFPGQGLIAAESMVSERDVRRSIQWLAEKRYLEFGKRESGRVNLYKLTLPAWTGITHNRQLNCRPAINRLIGVESVRFQEINNSSLSSLIVVNLNDHRDRQRPLELFPL